MPRGDRADAPRVDLRTDSREGSMNQSPINVRDPRVGQHGPRLRRRARDPGPRRPAHGHRAGHADARAGGGVRGGRRAVRGGAPRPRAMSTSWSSRPPTPPTCRWPCWRAAAGKHVYLEKPMALDVAECDQIIDGLPGRRRPADDRQADPPHGDVHAGQDVRRRGPDRRDPVPPPDERHARRRLRQRPPELAVRSARGRRVPRLGRTCLRRHPLVHRRGRRSAPTPTTTTSPACRSRAPR